MIARRLRRSAATLVAAASALLIAACATVVPRSSDVVVAANDGPDFRLLGVRTLPHRLVFGGTIVGGLSGIDRDPVDDLYYLISDDRSIESPTRFYTARLAIDEDGFHDAVLQSAVTLLRDDGTPYPRHAADAEAIRFDPATRDLWWSSEGGRKLGDGRHERLIDPFVRHAAVDGRALGEVPLPPMFRIVREPRGPRDNLVFEGLSLSTDLRSLWVSMEGPLLQDGPVPTAHDGAWSRFTRFDRDASGGFGAFAAQYAYRIDPIPSDGVWTPAGAQTGVSEILAVDPHRFLVLERAFVVGLHHWRIRLFEADVTGATDVAAIDSLVDAAAPRFVPIAKSLVLDFDRLGFAVDNLEGLCFGPTLANGHRTLVLVSDDNFGEWQTTQLVALEIVPR